MEGWPSLVYGIRLIIGRTEKSQGFKSPLLISMHCLFKLLALGYVAFFISTIYLQTATSIVKYNQTLVRRRYHDPKTTRDHQLYP